ncbi:MAG: filamentous hemagglutinin N-terminal domain-containing protein, partial [Verrucomicrobiota bacterium]
MSLVLGWQWMPLALWANPFGENVIRGNASFERNGSTLTITQGSEKVIINWEDFSISHGELTKFLQPGATSAALNRVVSGAPSEIYGSL